MGVKVFRNTKMRTFLTAIGRFEIKIQIQIVIAKFYNKFKYWWLAIVGAQIKPDLF